MSSKKVFDPVVHDPASVDNVPIEVPLEWREPPSLQEEIRRYVRVEMSRVAAENGHETFEEANDLEFSDDDDFGVSANELTEDQEMAMMALARVSRDNGEGHGGREQVGDGKPSGGVVDSGSVDGSGNKPREADGAGGRPADKADNGGEHKVV